MKVRIRVIEDGTPIHFRKRAKGDELEVLPSEARTLRAAGLVELVDAEAGEIEPATAAIDDSLQEKATAPRGRGRTRG